MTSNRAASNRDDAKTLAAVMAGVEAYLEAEALELRTPASTGRSRWKTAPWQVLRGSGPQTVSPWRQLR